MWYKKNIFLLIWSLELIKPYHKLLHNSHVSSWRPHHPDFEIFDGSRLTQPLSVSLKLKLIIPNAILSTSCIYSLKWVPQKPTDNSTLLQVTAWSRAVEMLVWACVGCRNINQLIFHNGYSAQRRIYYLDFKSVHRLVLFCFDLIIFKMDVCDLLAHILHDCITVTP